MAIARIVTVATLGLVTSSCGASSPYDATWVGTELARATAQPAPRSASLAGFAPELPPGTKDLRALTEDEAVSTALWNSAAFRADLASLGTSRADLADAAALPNPNLSFLFPVSTRDLELSATYPIAALLQRPARIAAAKLDVERTARSLVQSGLDTIRDVRLAWAELEAASLRRTVRERASALAERSAAIAKARFQSGDVSALEADIVTTEALAAAQLAVRSVQEQAIAKVRLRGLLGLAESPLGAELGIRLGSDPAAALALDAMEQAALGARPELRAAALAIDAAGERVGLEKIRILQLFARLDAKPIGPRGSGPLVWPPGFTAEIPLFNQNPGGRARAHAELERASWSYVAVRQRVLTEVRTAHEELSMALASREPWRKTIVPMQEQNVVAATHAYEAGSESYLVVLDATRRLVDATSRDVELGLDIRRAQANLDRAVGRRLHANGK